MSVLARAGRLVVRLPVLLLIGLVRLYQATVSPLLGPVCRFYPSCSHYGLGALRTHGAVRGTALTVWRILRCNPWNPGGVDLVPPARGHSRSGAADPATTTVSTATTDHTATTADTDDDVPAQPAAA